MTTSPLPREDLLRELTFTVSRSSGAGGQHVNKVSTKVTLKFDIPASKVLTDDQKQQLMRLKTSSITKDGVIVLSVQINRSQLANKEEAVKKFEHILEKAFTKPIVRKATKPNKSAKQKRILNKKLISEKKQWRKKSF